MPVPDRLWRLVILEAAQHEKIVRSGRKSNRGILMEMARARRFGRPPIEVAQDLVESVASEVEFDQVMELDYEVADRLAVVWGRTVLADRLWSAKGQMLQLHIAHPIGPATRCDSAGALVVEGRLVDLGPDWLVLDSSAAGAVVPHMIVPLAKVLGVAGLPEVAGRPPQQSRIWSHRKLTQLLRPLVGSAQQIRVHSELGCVNARVVRVAADHIDLELMDTHNRPEFVYLSVLFTAISYFEADLD